MCVAEPVQVALFCFCKSSEQCLNRWVLLCKQVCCLVARRERELWNWGVRMGPQAAAAAAGDTARGSRRR
jgi:hypothetical protein